MGEERGGGGGGGGGGGMDRWEGQWQHIHLCNITG